MPAPTVHGEVVELYSVSQKYRVIEKTINHVPGSTEYTKVTEVPRFDVDNSSTGDRRNNGAVVGLRVSAVEEPTLEERGGICDSRRSTSNYPPHRTGGGVRRVGAAGG